MKKAIFVWSYYAVSFESYKQLNDHNNLSVLHLIEFAVKAERIILDL